MKMPIFFSMSHANPVLLFAFNKKISQQVLYTARSSIPLHWQVEDGVKHQYRALVGAKKENFWLVWRLEPPRQDLLLNPITTGASTDLYHPLTATF
ncbi:hypothetical protein COCSUDRAFT_34280 [Coccomyxa subellipsoidea C-169]|uniref:Uncharacterized protein n=1 Tax=Coccomyxa subellipsoidea (strain C-169) TaxID=574566 RepID=I0YLV1_COCSC|nr:hypothetical protein COCSUDRAFT_34280 [Coccomyxa subellipsoidea C-169]EIE19370.1 hypothetical protein COCSUDRAFT_34280 [Coccomyxa subellipsoidea C-169]|eukprot:XP_005643914.1 hypothetical protein COCSUDRAFT_34280 [Coccomyxa subellipsoidea C-169]